MPSKPTVTSPQIPGANAFTTSPLEHVRVLYVAFVKGLFASAPPGEYHWSPGEETEIYISDESPIQSDKAGQRPAISFTRGSVQFYSLGLGDIMDYDFATGRRRKGVLIPGVMSINCCSRTDLESERLAFIIAEHIWLLREKLIHAGQFFDIGRQPIISATSPAGSLVANEGGQEWVCTSVQSPFQFPRMSQATPLNQNVVESIELQLRTERAKLLSKGWPASDGHELPVDLHTCPPESYAPAATDTWGRTPDPGADATSPSGKYYHPLNPTVEVRIRSVNPYRPGLARPSMNGRPIPLGDPCVEQSSVNPLVFRTKI